MIPSARHHMTLGGSGAQRRSDGCDDIGDQVSAWDARPTGTSNAMDRATSGVVRQAAWTCTNRIPRRVRSITPTVSPESTNELDPTPKGVPAPRQGAPGR